MISFENEKIPSDDTMDKFLTLYVKVKIFRKPLKRMIVNTSSNVNMCSLYFLQKIPPSIE